MNKNRIQSGNEGEELIPGKTENLSSSLHQRGDAALPDAQMDEDADERGEPARFNRRTGEVHGSGSDVGGGGTSGENYDQDAAAGSTKADPQVPRR